MVRIVNIGPSGHQNTTARISPEADTHHPKQTHSACLFLWTLNGAGICLQALSEQDFHIPKKSMLWIIEGDNRTVVHKVKWKTVGPRNFAKVCWKWEVVAKT